MTTQQEEIEKQLIAGAKKLLGDAYDKAKDFMPGVMKDAGIPVRKDTIEAFIQGVKTGELIGMKADTLMPGLVQKLGKEEAQIFGKGMFVAIFLDFQREFNENLAKATEASLT